MTNNQQLGPDRRNELESEYVGLLKAFAEDNAEPDADLRAVAIRQRLELERMCGGNLEGDVAAYRQLKRVAEAIRSKIAARDKVDAAVSRCLDARREAESLRARAAVVEADGKAGVDRAYNEAYIVAHERDMLSHTLRTCAALNREVCRMMEAGEIPTYVELEELEESEPRLYEVNKRAGEPERGFGSFGNAFYGRG